jgi:RimJ/RimL family protein N-acetyltransferase
MALFIGHWNLRGYGWWAVEDRRTGDFLGRIGLYNPEGWPGIEVGWLLRRDVWGAGLATEGAIAALDFALNVVGADHVISLIDPGNARSIRVAEKIGERYERDLVHKEKTVAVYGTRR